MITATVKGDAIEVNALLAQVPGMVQESVFRKGLRPAAKIVENKLRELTLRSSESGSTKKWSKSTAEKRSGETPLWKTTATKIWRAKNGNAFAFVGYSWPRGNKAHFVVQSAKGRTRRQVYWGKRTANLSLKSDVLKRSIDETRVTAGTAMVSGIRKEVEKRKRAMRLG